MIMLCILAQTGRACYSRFVSIVGLGRLITSPGNVLEPRSATPPDVVRARRVSGERTLMFLLGCPQTLPGRGNSNEYAARVQGRSGSSRPCRRRPDRKSTRLNSSHL